MDLSEILIRPIQTEKADNLREKNRTYEFHVRKDANKIDIAKAVESVFSVKVDSVHTVIRKGKTKDWAALKVNIQIERGHSSLFTLVINSIFLRELDNGSQEV